MKALILAGGRGKRLNEISAEHNKCMLPMGGKPVIEFSLQRASETGVREIVVVVGYKAEEIINVYGNVYAGLPLRYVIQSEQRGLVHALECSKASIGSDDFVLFLGDEVMIGARHREMVARFQSGDVFGLCGVVTVQDRQRISQTYAVIQDSERRIYRLIEKPRKPFNDLMGTGNCVFRNDLLDLIDLTPINQSRGEKELPDLIQCAIDEGQVVTSFDICDSYVNINSEEDLCTAERLILQSGELE